jgi:hypothetical protein
MGFSGRRKNGVHPATVCPCNVYGHTLSLPKRPTYVSGLTHTHAARNSVRHSVSNDCSAVGDETYGLLQTPHFGYRCDCCHCLPTSCMGVVSLTPPPSRPLHVLALKPSPGAAAGNAAGTARSGDRCLLYRCRTALPAATPGARWPWVTAPAGPQSRGPLASAPALAPASEHASALPPPRAEALQGQASCVCCR